MAKKEELKVKQYALGALQGNAEKERLAREDAVRKPADLMAKEKAFSDAQKALDEIKAEAVRIQEAASQDDEVDQSGKRVLVPSW